MGCPGQGISQPPEVPILLEGLQHPECLAKRHQKSPLVNMASSGHSGPPYWPPLVDLDPVKHIWNNLYNNKWEILFIQGFLPDFDIMNAYSTCVFSIAELGATVAEW